MVLPTVAILLGLLLQSGVSVQGTIASTQNGHALTKARVQLSPWEGHGETYSATASETGNFAFENVKPGQYRLTASKDGYVIAFYGQRGPNGKGQPITVVAGQAVNDIAVRMIPTAAIAGRVINREGEPVGNATVQLFQYKYPASYLEGVYLAGPRIPTVVQTTQTDDLGQYRFFYLNPGQYHIGAGRMTAGATREVVEGSISTRSATGTPIASLALSIPKAYAPTYFPGVRTPDNSTPVVASPGATVSVDLVLAIVNVVHVRGRVVSRGAAPLPRTVSLIAREGPPGGMRATGSSVAADGRFDLTVVVPGRYDISAETAGFFGRTTIEVADRDIENILLTLAPTIDVSGKVVVENRGIPQTDEFKKLKLVFWLDGGFTNLRDTYEKAADLGPDGSFGVKLNGFGDYHLHVGNMMPDQYIKSVRVGGADVLNGNLHLEDRPVAGLEVVIGRTASSIEGAVQDGTGTPSAYVTVALVPDPDHRQRFELYRSVSTDASGRFRLASVIPGNYTLLSWADVDDDARRDPDFVRKYESLGEAISVGVDTTTTTRLTIIPDGESR